MRQSNCGGRRTSAEVLIKYCDYGYLNQFKPNLALIIENSIPSTERGEMVQGDLISIANITECSLRIQPIKILFTFIAPLPIYSFIFIALSRIRKD